MSAIMQQLKADHGNISRLLATLEEQMDVVHDEEIADFELMHDIMAYMTHYADHTHPAPFSLPLPQATIDRSQWPPRMTSSNMGRRRVRVLKDKRWGK